MESNLELLYTRHYLAYVLAEESESGRTEALRLFRELLSDHEGDTWNQKYFLNILLLLGKERMAIQEARPLLKEGFTWYWTAYSTEYLIGEMKESDYATRCAEVHYAELWAHFDIGMKSLARGDKLKAKGHFGRIRNTGMFGNGMYHWGNAFYARLQEDPDWPHWIPTKRMDETTDVESEDDTTIRE